MTVTTQSVQNFLSLVQDEKDGLSLEEITQSINIVITRWKFAMDTVMVDFQNITQPLRVNIDSQEDMKIVREVLQEHDILKDVYSVFRKKIPNKYEPDEHFTQVIDLYVAMMVIVEPYLIGENYYDNLSLEEKRTLFSSQSLQLIFAYAAVAWSVMYKDEAQDYNIPFQ